MGEFPKKPDPTTHSFLCGILVLLPALHQEFRWVLVGTLWLQGHFVDKPLLRNGAAGW